MTDLGKHTNNLALAYLEDPSSINLERVFEGTKRLVYSMIKKLGLVSDSSFFEDLQQEGYIGILEALNNFNPEKGSFTYFATFYINKRLLIVSRKESFPVFIPEGTFNKVGYDKIVEVYPILGYSKSSTVKNNEGDLVPIYDTIEVPNMVESHIIREEEQSILVKHIFHLMNEMSGKQRVNFKKHLVYLILHEELTSMDIPFTLRRIASFHNETAENARLNVNKAKKKLLEYFKQVECDFKLIGDFNLSLKPLSTKDFVNNYLEKYFNKNDIVITNNDILISYLFAELEGYFNTEVLQLLKEEFTKEKQTQTNSIYIKLKNKI